MTAGTGQAAAPRILLVTYGSVGDVRPLAALGQVLQARGARINVCAPPDSRGLVAAAGLPFHPLGADVQQLMKTYAGRMVGRPLAAMGPMTHILRRQLESQFRQLPAHIATADRVVSAGLALAVPSVAEAYGVPHIYAVSIPLLLPSRHHPPLTVPWQNLPALCNRTLWWLASEMLDWRYRTLINRHRRRLRLAPLSRILPHLSANLLVAADRELAPLPPDAPTDCRQTGYWHALPGGTPLPAKIENFLNDGPPPVFIGFGSMGDPAPQRTAVLLREAVQRSGWRAIIQSGWAGWSFNSDATALCVPHPLPHDRLLPRVAAAVHHGGAGTVMAAARAGIPQAIVPHLLDQYYWGQRVRQLGIGPPPLNRSRLNVDRLARMIGRVAGSAPMRAKARALAVPLKRRRGTLTAADWILHDWPSVRAAGT